jgi:hypothetical protein
MKREWNCTVCWLIDFVVFTSLYIVRSSLTNSEWAYNATWKHVQNLRPGIFVLPHIIQCHEGHNLCYGLPLCVCCKMSLLLLYLFKKILFIYLNFVFMLNFSYITSKFHSVEISCDSDLPTVFPTQFVDICIIYVHNEICLPRCSQWMLNIIARFCSSKLWIM